MEKDGFKFDLQTQRFLVTRWETDLGRAVRDEIIEGIKGSGEIRGILDRYVLDHPENIEPYGYPVYPPSEVGEGRFWVLTSDDLRGIRFFNEDFSKSRSLEKKQLSYAAFHNVDLTNVTVEMSDLSYCRFTKCNMSNAVFWNSGGFNVIIESCNLSGAALFEVALRDPSLKGSICKNIYFEEVLLENLKLDYLTQFDLKIRAQWSGRTTPLQKIPDVLRSIRLAYETAELWEDHDRFFALERRLHRKYILWTRLGIPNYFSGVWAWLISRISDITSAYGTKPSRLIVLGLIVSVGFAAVYFAGGPPSGEDGIVPAGMEALYFSLTTFATLGYGDLSYDVSRPLMRLLSTAEAWTGVVLISAFVVVLSRKLFR